MGCGCKGKKGQTKDMSRGEFLGVGAAAAATLGTVGVEAGADAEEDIQNPCASKPNYCGAFLNDPPDDPIWSVPASVLQVLWGDLFPRMVAEAWLNYSPNPFVPGEITPAELTNRINSYLNSSTGGQNPTPGSPFMRRVQVVLDYLANTPVNEVIRIRYLGPGGFDFILSDHGLDLFAPPWPTDDEAALLRYFQFRATGRSTIGIPSYLDGPEALAFDVQSPSGPSMVWTDTNGLNAPISYTGCRLGSLPCLDDPGQNHPAIDPSGEVDRRRFPEFIPVKNFTTEAFYAAASKTRCWQLEGSVYRGILEQLPRVVATIWREHYTGYSANPVSYFMRWFSDPNDIRSIFMERLETSLPKANEMQFKLEPLDDVLITNHGLVFPALDDPRNPTDTGVTGNVPLPDWKTMVEAISTGAAGNPVFTDTRRPPRK